MLKNGAIRFVVALILGTTAVNAQAVMVNGSPLLIGGGSWWGWIINTNGDMNATSMTGHAGLITATTQATGTSHSGCPNGTEGILSNSIDEPVCMFGHTAMHFTTSPTNVLSASGNTATIDMSGWKLTWTGISSIPYGSGAWNGTVNVTVGSDPSFSHSFSGITDGVGNVTCGVDCGYGDTYVLEYTSTVPSDDPSGLGGTQYALHLSGTVAAVPLPPALWLLGSGLFSLLCVARRSKR